ncbi:MAG: MHYT domain-containing protein [Opitutaceae bacterium]
MQAEYNRWIVALSYVIAVIASYVALDMASRVSANRGTSRARYWLLGGAVAMGAGIWSMHFVGMLAFSLPIPVPYNVPITFLSMGFAIGASGIALYAISRGELSRKKLLGSGTVMGCGVALMHYTGMAALQIRPRPIYDPGLFSLSIAIAIAASIAAMWICFQLKADTMATAFWKKSASALIMGVAIWGMHFTAMAAAIFAPDSYCIGNPESIDHTWLATTVGLCTALFLAATMFIAFVDAKTREHRVKLEAQSERFFNQSLNLICICGFDGRFLRLNPATSRTLGYARDPLLAIRFLDIVRQEDRPTVDAAIQELIGGLTAQAVECQCLCADGSSKSLLWNLTRSEDGAGFYATGNDITDRKRAEAELAQTHQRLLDVSRAAGMTEVATGVLHNVGNVLNSVNVSATLVMDHVRHTKAANVAKLSTLLDQHKGDLGDFLSKDARGQMIPDYLSSLSAELANEHAATLAELDHLRKNIEHIKEIVTMQQSYAKTSGFTETVSLANLIDDALHINAGSLARHEVRLVREYRVKPVVAMDKHKVMQILINLVRNAKYACDESGRSDKLITVQTTAGKHCVQITVCDNGIGIPPENLTRIFNHGFTTRKTGHGFGLHSAALAAKELGGSLSATSEGLGRGATFILELPHKPDAAAN